MCGVVWTVQCMASISNEVCCLWAMLRHFDQATHCPHAVLTATSTAGTLQPGMLTPTGMFTCQNTIIAACA
jgi:hypothetical protein